MTARVLFLVNAFEADAPTRLMMEVARTAQASNNYECHLATLTRSGPAQTEAASVAKSAKCLQLNATQSLLDQRKLRAYLRELAPDLVHASLLRPTLGGVVAARRANVPRVVVTCHGTHEWGEAGPLPERLVRAWYTRVVRRADAVVGVSGQVREELARAGVPERILCVVPNGVDVRRFMPADGPGVSRTPGTVRIGAAGNLRRIKGFDTFLEALHILAASSTELPLLEVRLWGDGPERESLASIAEQLRSSRIRIQLEGRRTDMASALRSCDIYVQPSRREAFGLAAAEAMACGIPVIASAVGGLPELVGSGRAAGGRLVSPDSPRELAAALIELIRSPKLRVELGAAGRERVLEQFTLDAMTRGYMTLYEQLLSS